MSSRNKLVVIFGFVTVNLAYSMMAEDYMYSDTSTEHGCSSTMPRFTERVQRRPSGLLYSHRPFDPQHYPHPMSMNLNCDYVILAPPGYRVRLRFSMFDLRGRSSYAGHCEGDTLHILDYPETVRSVEPDSVGELTTPQYCGTLPNDHVTFTSTANAAAFWLHISDTGSAATEENHKGFKILWTIFRVPATCNDNSARGHEFQCANGDCIPWQYGCDAHAHCSDFSDLDGVRQYQANCPAAINPTAALSMNATLCLVITSLVSVVLLVGCCAAYLTRRASSKHPPSTATWSLSSADTTVPPHSSESNVHPVLYPSSPNKMEALPASPLLPFSQRCPICKTKRCGHQILDFV